MVEYIPLQEGFLFWKKNILIGNNCPAFLDIQKELIDKGFDVNYIPHLDEPLCSSYPKYTNIRIKPNNLTSLMSNSEGSHSVSLTQAIGTL
jgi:hypothetical protein